MNWVIRKRESKLSSVKKRQGVMLKSSHTATSGRGATGPKNGHWLANEERGKEVSPVQGGS